MAVYKIALRVNDADVTPPPSPSNSAATEQNNEEATVSDSKQLRQISNSPKSASSSSAANMAKYTAEQTFTPQYQQTLYHKTVNLIATRTMLNKKLARAFSQRDKFSHKLLDRHYRLKHQESKHLAARTRLLAEIEKQYKANPSAERAKDMRLVRKLLRSFRHHLKSDIYSHKYRSSRPSPFRSISTSPSSSDMDDHETGVNNSTITIAAEQLALEMTKAGGSTRKRRASQRSNASLATLFAQDESDQTSGENGGRLVVAKKAKKLKLDLEDGERLSAAVDGPPKTPTNPVFDEKEIKSETPANEEECKVDAFADDKPKEAEQKAPAAELSPAKPIASKKEEKPDASSAVAPSPKTPVYPSKEKRGSIASPATASPSSSKKHPLALDETESPKIKKTKVDPESTSITPAIPATSPKKAISTTAIVPSRKYHEQAVYNMLNDPLGFHDLVYDDTRPVHKRPKFGRLGFRYKKPPPNFSPMMCGGIGKEVAEITAPVPLQKKEPKESSKQQKGHQREREGSLSQQVMKKNHHDKITQTVREGKAAMASHQKKLSSTTRVDGLTEKGKYSVNKEARYGNNNHKNGKKNNHNNGFKGGNGSGGGNGNKAGNVSSARRQLHAVRSQYSLFTTSGGFS